MNDASTQVFLARRNTLFNEDKTRITRPSFSVRSEYEPNKIVICGPKKGAIEGEKLKRQSKCHGENFLCAAYKLIATKCFKHFIQTDFVLNMKKMFINFFLLSKNLWAIASTNATIAQNTYVSA